MKPILKYAVIRGTVPGQPFRMIGVTHIAGRQVYGRFADGASTHCAEHDVLTYLPDEGAARLFLERAEKVKARCRRSIKEAEAALNFAVNFEQNELRTLVREAQAAADAQR